MANKIDAPLPAGFVLGPGWTVRVTAVDPTTGALVTGVKVSNVVINGDTASAIGAASQGALTPVQPLLVLEEGQG